MEEVQFYKLPRSVQDRFIDAARGAAAPTPFLAVPYRESAHWRWVLAAIVSGAALAVVATRGYGRLDSSAAIASKAMIPVYAGLVALTAVFALRALAIWRAPMLMPYRPGYYLFPCGVIDTSHSTFRLCFVNEASDIQVAGSNLVLRFGSGEKFSFNAGTAQRAEEAKVTMEDARQRFAEALATLNRRELAAMDPLRDTGFSNPFSPKTARQPPKQRWSFSAVPVAVALSLAVGWQAWDMRNAWSEHRLFNAARALDTPEAYHAFLERGGKRADVAEVLLPRAELKRAQKQGTVEAIERFERTHHNAKIKPEVGVAMRAALLDSLERAKKTGTLGALRDFEKRHAAHAMVQAEYDAAVDGVFARALADFRTNMSREDEGLLQFAQRLLDFARRNGPRAEIRFRRVVKTSLQKSDQQIQKDAYYAGAVSQPAQYFDETHAREREQRIGAVLQQAWQRAIPSDIVRFELGPPVAEQEGPLPEAQVPTLFVEHSTAGAGIYRSPRPRGVFIGIGLVFSVAFKIPSDPQSLTFRSSAWLLPDLQALKNGDLKLEDVYNRLGDTGFDRFGRQCTAAWFRTK